MHLHYIAGMRLIPLMFMAWFSNAALAQTVGSAPTEAMECVHVCGKYCVSKAAADRSKFRCPSEAVDQCFRDHGHCVFVKGKGCGWQYGDDLSQCMEGDE